MQEIADHIGDSFYLSKVAVGLKEQTIVFCGVSFMGESAKVLNPEKTVLMPDMDADCPMAHMADAETIQKMREKYEDLAVVCYINSTAELKKYSDVCVISANAVQIVKALPNKHIFFIPDRNLAHYIAEQVPEKEFVYNEGFCPTHERLQAEEVLEAKMEMKTDVVIVGTGVGGLFAALNLPEEKQIIMITKADLESSDSFLAQGGICVLRDDEDYDSYFEDTMRAGHYENRKESVNIMIRSSREIIRDLIGYGVDFARENGELAFTREGAHSKPRILFHEDITGKEITSKLITQVKKRKNIKIYEYTTMTDVVEEDGICSGIVATAQDGTEMKIFAPDTILASGGIGGRYKHSTNFPHLTGDALDVAKKHGIRLEHLDYVQIHPTTLYSTKPGRRFLISESVRGEGAVLYNKKKERFVNELLPRDVVTKAIKEEMEKDGTDFVWLSMEHLYAVGETSCNGVHGANRLASNSLLESLVFAKRAANRISGRKNEVKPEGSVK